MEEKREKRREKRGGERRERKKEKGERKEEKEGEGKRGKSQVKEGALETATRKDHTRSIHCFGRQAKILTWLITLITTG